MAFDALGRFRRHLLSRSSVFLHERFRSVKRNPSGRFFLHPLVHVFRNVRTLLRKGPEPFLNFPELVDVQLRGKQETVRVVSRQHHIVLPQFDVCPRARRTTSCSGLFRLTQSQPMTSLGNLMAANSTATEADEQENRSWRGRQTRSRELGLLRDTTSISRLFARLSAT